MNIITCTAYSLLCALSLTFSLNGMDCFRYCMPCIRTQQHHYPIVPELNQSEYNHTTNAAQHPSGMFNACTTNVSTEEIAILEAQTAGYPVLYKYIQKHKIPGDLSPATLFPKDGIIGRIIFADMLRDYIHDKELKHTDVPKKYIAPDKQRVSFGKNPKTGLIEENFDIVDWKVWAEAIDIPKTPQFISLEQTKELAYIAQDTGYSDWVGEHNITHHEKNQKIYFIDTEPSSFANRSFLGPTTREGALRNFYTIRGKDMTPEAQSWLRDQINHCTQPDQPVTSLQNHVKNSRYAEAYQQLKAYNSKYKAHTVLDRS